MRMSMAEVFVMRDGLIAERRAWVIALTGERLPLTGRDFGGGSPGDA